MKFLAIVATLLASTQIALCSDYQIIHAGRLLAVPGEKVLIDQSIIIQDGIIVDVQPGFLEASSKLPDDDPDEIINLRNYFVLPGLIDGHTHITMELGPTTKLDAVVQSDAAVALRSTVYAKRTLEAGFTTVRNLGADPDVIIPLRDAIQRGDVIGPRIFAAAGGVSATGGHGDVHGYREEVLALFKPEGVCDGADDCRRAIRALVKRGADQIKIAATGGVLSETDAGTGQQLIDEELSAIVETAHGLGRRTAAHAHGVRGVNAALRAGVLAIEHGTYANAESFRLFKKNNAFLVPTILAGVTVAEMASSENSFMPPAIRAKALSVGPRMLGMVQRANQAGVKIAFGTDSGVSKHGQNAREFELLVEAGLTPMEAIVTATVNGAENLGKADQLGTIESGKLADIIAAGGDPLADITALQDIDFVMKGGVIFKRYDLLGLSDQN